MTLEVSDMYEGMSKQFREKINKNHESLKDLMELDNGKLNLDAKSSKLTLC